MDISKFNLELQHGCNPPNWVSSHPRTPPASPNAWDDEFNNSSSLSKWTWYKQGASTATFVNGGLLITASLNGAGDPNYDYSMLMRDVPSGDWEVHFLYS